MTKIFPMENMIGSSTIFTSSEIALYTEIIAEYLDRLEFGKIGDVDLVGRSLHAEFAQDTWLSKKNLNLKIKNLARIEHLSPVAQFSLNEKLGSIQEIYNDPSDWVIREKKNPLRELILKKISRVAHQLFHLDARGKRQLLKDGANYRSKVQADQAALQNATLTSVSTLTDLQQDQENQLREVIEINGLDEQRNPTLPLNEDSSILLLLLVKDRYLLKNYSELLCNNKPLVLMTVHNDALSLRFAGSMLRNDRDVVLKAVRKNGRALIYASSHLKGDREIAVSAVQQDGFALAHVSQELKGDKEIVMRALENRGTALQFASNALKNDKSIVMSALRNDPTAIRHVMSCDLKNDVEIAKLVASVLHSDLRINSSDFRCSAAKRLSLSEPSPRKKRIGAHFCS